MAIYSPQSPTPSSRNALRRAVNSCIVPKPIGEYYSIMATTKAGGSAKNLNDSNPKYLGVKRADGQKVGIGDIIVRQRGTKIMAGKNIGVGKDHTLFAEIAGTVHFHTKRKTNFDGRSNRRSIVDVV